jgi:hypothetical protein
VIHRDIEALDEANAKQLAGSPEYAILQHGIERKVGPDLRLIEGIFCLAHALRIKGPVPGLHGETALLVVDDFLNIGLLAFRAGAAAGTMPRINSSAAAGVFAIWSAMLQLA